MAKTTAKKTKHTSNSRPSYADLQKLVAKQQKELNGSKKKSKHMDKGETEESSVNEDESDNESDEERERESDSHSHKKHKHYKRLHKHAITSSSNGSEESDASVNAKRSHKHKRKTRKKTLVPKPFGTAGKKGNGERGSKGYCLREKMGLADDEETYLDIRAEVRNQIAHFHLTGKKRNQDPKTVAIILVEVEKKFRFLRQFENSWPIEDMITGMLTNRTDYQKNKIVQRPKKAAQARERRKARQVERGNEDVNTIENRDKDGAAQTETGTVPPMSTQAHETTFFPDEQNNEAPDTVTDDLDNSVKLAGSHGNSLLSQPDMQDNPIFNSMKMTKRLVNLEDSNDEDENELTALDESEEEDDNKLTELDTSETEPSKTQKQPVSKPNKIIIPSRAVNSHNIHNEPPNKSTKNCSQAVPIEKATARVQDTAAIASKKKIVTTYATRHHNVPDRHWPSSPDSNTFITSSQAQTSVSRRTKTRQPTTNPASFHS